jgi:hypothetical protein
MSDSSDSTPELVGDAPMTPTAGPQPDVTDPAKLIRLGTMLQTMLTELKDTETDAASLKRLAQIHHETIDELGEILRDDLHEELLEFNDCCGTETPSESEMRVAHAQLVGWIQGLLRGMQATATAQAQMAQQQMMMMQAQMQQRSLVGPGGSQRGLAQQGMPRAQANDSDPEVPDAGYL